MKDKMSLSHSLWSAIAGLFLLLGNQQASAQETPLAPATTGGTYTVLFTWPVDCYWTYLQERVGPSGAWTYVDTGIMQPAGGLGVNANFTNKPAGEYYYRIEVLYTDEYGGSSYAWSDATRVLVSGGGGGGPGTPASQDLMSNQVGYTYEARIGDINGDGRQDVFVQRTAGGQSGNGTLDKVILRRLADGTFTPDVPTAMQISTASAWPVSSTRITMDDINFDGYIDIRLPDLGSVISGAVGQIVFSPGQPGVFAPQKVTQMGAKYTKFNDDMNLWIDEPNYFTDHAPIIWVPVYGYVYVCDYYDEYNCWYELQIIGYQGYYDFSSWDPDAVNMRYSFNKVVNGVPQPDIVAGSDDAKRIAQLFQNVYGVPLMRGVLQNNCYDYDYDPETGLPCVEFDFTILIADVPRARGCRGLTVSEKLATVEERIFIENVDQVRVCNRHYLGKWIPAIVRFGRGSNMAPDGNVYIAPLSQGGFVAWREDYTQPPARDYEFASLLHELTHVFQVRNGNCIHACIIRKALAARSSGGYTYMPLVPGRAFNQYNIEQQAEMVEDRFRLSRGLGAAPTELGDPNHNADFTSLNNLIPTLQGFYDL